MGTGGSAPLSGYEQSDAMGMRTMDRGVKECIYLNETQRAENERATVSRDLTEAPSVDVRARAPTHLESYQIHAVNSAPAPIDESRRR